MRSLTLACAGLALMGGVISVHLWRELRAEREVTAQLRSEVGGLRAGIGSLPSGGAGQLQQSGLEKVQAAAPASQTAPAPAGNQPQPTSDLQRLVVNRNELLKDPEYRKAALAQARFSLPQRYPGLTEELGLTAEEADRLFDLLAENQLELNAMMVPITIGANGTPDTAAMQEMTRSRQELQRQQEQELRTLLGSGRYTQWEQYQETLVSRQQVVQLGRTLESAGAPLSPEQSRPLIAAYAVEQKRQSEELRRLLTASGPTSPPDQQRLQEERLRMQEDSNRRLVEAARPHLNARQVEALQASLDQQLAMNRASNRMMEIQRQAQGANAPQGNVLVLPAAAAF